jgi:hypothetical protein
MGTPEVLSPDLVLVSAELRAEALAALPSYPWERPIVPVAEEGLRGKSTSARVDRSMAWRIVQYLAWRILVGVSVGLGVVVSVGFAMLALSFIAR